MNCPREGSSSLRIKIEYYLDFAKNANSRRFHLPCHLLAQTTDRHEKEMRPSSFRRLIRGVSQRTLNADFSNAICIFPLHSSTDPVSQQYHLQTRTTRRVLNGRIMREEASLFSGLCIQVHRDGKAYWRKHGRSFFIEPPSFTPLILRIDFFTSPFFNPALSIVREKILTLHLQFTHNLIYSKRNRTIFTQVLLFQIRFMFNPIMNFFGSKTNKSTSYQLLLLIVC